MHFLAHAFAASQSVHVHISLSHSDEVARMMILLGQRLLAVDLVEVVLLSDNVQDLRRVLAVVGGVPLAYVLHPEQELL